jgi:hypothetical protein
VQRTARGAAHVARAVTSPLNAAVALRGRAVRFSSPTASARRHARRFTSTARAESWKRDTGYTFAGDRPIALKQRYFFNAAIRRSGPCLGKVKQP